LISIKIANFKKDAKDNYEQPSSPAQGIAQIHLGFGVDGFIFILLIFVFFLVEITML
jgi:hypothetical protein